MANLRIILTIPFFIFTGVINAQNNAEEIQEMKSEIKYTPSTLFRYKRVCTASSLLRVLLSIY